MTSVNYRCSGADGAIFETSSLAQAKQFIQEHGGSYEILFNYVECYSESYTRANPRRVNSRT